MNATKDLVKKTDDSLIYTIRGHKVMLDEDLARIYGVTTTRLNEQVKRNLERFPKDFMFQLTEKEYESLRSQFAISNAPEDNLRSQSVISKKEDKNLKSQSVTSSGRGGRRYMPYAFTEHGTVMLASVLNSPKAVHASIQVVKAFVRLRELITANKTLSKRLDELEDNYDKKFAVVFDAIRRLMSPPVKAAERKPLGYKRKDEK